MINRLLAANLAQDLQFFPAVALLGARQVGKTTLAQNMATQLKAGIHYLDLENPLDVNKLSKDPYTYLEKLKDSCVIIDEVQRMPELFSILRPLIDAYRIPGRFLLLGSASPALIKGVSESLAGRISYVQLHPVSLTEALYSGINQDTHWFRGGFPDALLAKNDALARRWTDDFINTYIEKDLSSLFDTQFPIATMRNFWAMLANSNGGIWNAAVFARSLGISATTVNHYLDFLEGAFMINRLPAWFVNVKKRVVKSPKVYLRDSGLLHRLCRVTDFQHLHENLVIGTSWEGYVIENILRLKSSDLGAFYYRTQHGAECDLVLVSGITPVACIEIKKSNAPQPSRGFYETIKDLQTASNYIITPESDSYTFGEGITICNLAYYLNEILNKAII